MIPRALCWVLGLCCWNMGLDNALISYLEQSPLLRSLDIWVRYMRFVACQESVLGCSDSPRLSSKSRVRAYASAVQDFYVPSADLCMVGKIYMPTTNCFFPSQNFYTSRSRLIESTQVHFPLTLTIRASNALNWSVPQWVHCFPIVIPRKPFAELDEPRIIALLKTQDEHRHSRMLGP